MDNDLEEYTVYCNESQILDVIKKQETIDVFRTLILHGFDIDFDEMKETYIGIARRNDSDLCINVIQDTGLDSNISLYIDASVEKSDDKLWAIQKKEMQAEVEEYIDSYESYEVFDYSKEEIESVENFLGAIFGDCEWLNKPKKSDIPKKPEKKESNKIIPLDLANATISSSDKNKQQDKQIDEDVVSYTFEINNDVVKVSCIDEELFLIEENDYEVAVNINQMEFIVECYYKIMDYLKDKKSR